MNIIKRKDYRLVVLSDEHCGHLSGLTPIDYQGKFVTDTISKHNKLTTIQRENWNIFQNEINILRREKPIDILVNNGDFLDGLGVRSGGTELITTDRTKQIDMCEEIMNTVGADYNVIVSGTPYHTGEQEDWEEELAKRTKSKFESHAWLDINKTIFDFKHFIGSSGTPHTRQAPIAKEALWATLWGEANLVPKPVSYLIRSHVHYFSLIDSGDMIALTTPALQAFGSKFGARKCSGIPRIGFLSFDILASGEVIMRKHFANIISQKAKATIFN